MVPTDAVVLNAVGAHAGLMLLHSRKLAAWFVFRNNTAELVGRIPDSMTLREAAAKLGEIAGEMGALYALRDEARFAPPPKQE